MPVSADGEGGSRLRVRVTPRARQNAITGAEALGIPKSSVRIVSGETNRLKTLSLAHVPPEQIAAWIKQSS